MLIWAPLARAAYRASELLRLRCDASMRGEGLWRTVLLRLNANRLVRAWLRLVFWITNPLRAVVIGDRNDRFFKYGWLTLDLTGPVDFSVNIRTRSLPFANNSVGYLYASHVLEHLNDGELRAFLKECHRVLIPGGFFRIVVPDMALFLRSYREDGLSLHFDRPAAHATAHSIRDGLMREGGKEDDLEPHNGLLSVVASFSNGHPPLRVSRDELESHLEGGNLDRFVSWAAGFKPSEGDFGHSNGFDFPRMARFLRAAGFDRVSKGFYADPFVPRRMKGLDLANKQHISLYVNAARS